MNLNIDDNTVKLYDPHSEFGQHLADSIPAIGADPVEILIQLEDFVIEQLGDVVIRANRGSIRITSK